MLICVTQKIILIPESMICQDIKSVIPYIFLLCISAAMGTERLTVPVPGLVRSEALTAEGADKLRGFLGPGRKGAQHRGLAKDLFQWGGEDIIDKLVFGQFPWQLKKVIAQALPGFGIIEAEGGFARIVNFQSAAAQGGAQHELYPVKPAGGGFRQALETVVPVGHLGTQNLSGFKGCPHAYGKPGAPVAVKVPCLPIVFAYIHVQTSLRFSSLAMPPG